MPPQADSRVAIQIGDTSKLDWMRRHVPTQRGIPSHDTFCRVLLDPPEFEASFVRWMRGLCQAPADEVVAIDKKTRAAHAAQGSLAFTWFRHGQAEAHLRLCCVYRDVQ
ncbi:transposase family protein [Burkholderia pyrrocinia]|uniref:transposase family protein n=1 Tax=Burkholderia pyrrocinia TaxID=60550 RepID=UPI00158D6A57